MQYSFGERLKELRSDLSLTQEQFATVLNLSRSTVAYYESGMRSPDIQKLILIADYFNVSLDYLLGRTNIKDIISSDNEAGSLLECFFNLNLKEQNFIIKQIKAFRLNHKDVMFAAEKKLDE